MNPRRAVVFFDMDGVIADFVSGLCENHAPTTIDRTRIKTWDIHPYFGYADQEQVKMWERLGFEFWRDLPVLDDGMALLARAESIVGKENIAILTSPAKASPNCYDGKLAWIKRHLPDYERRLLVCPAKHLIAGPGKVLVDDYDGNTDKFDLAHPHASSILVPRPWNRRRNALMEDGHSFDVPFLCQQLEDQVMWSEYHADESTPLADLRPTRLHTAAG